MYERELIVFTVSLSSALTEQLSELESKIRQGKTRCIQEKKAGRVESAKMIYLEVISREKEGKYCLGCAGLTSFSCQPS